MHSRIRFALIAFLLPVMAFGQPYIWFTDQEDRPYGSDGDYEPFGPSEGFAGVARSNDQITIAGSPTLGRIITSASSFIEGPDYNPIFSELPTFNALPLDWGGYAETVRNHADRYESPGDNKQQRMIINGSDVTLYTWDLGEAFDPEEATATNFPISQGGLCYFTEVPLELAGENITGQITIGSARRIRLIDDVRVAGPYEPTTEPGDFRVSYDNQNYVGIVSEGDIKIANNIQNGRENSNGLGMEQPSQQLSDIVITAALISLGGSFEFEYQNDLDSGYVCDCSPDWRGDIWIFGSVHQRDRGYLSRTNNGGTGYRLRLRFDARFPWQMPPCLSGGADSIQQFTDTLDFGDVVVGETARDTAQIHTMSYSTLGAVIANWPYYAERIEPWFGTEFVIPCSFTPPSTGVFNGMLNVSTTYHFYQIVLRGRGVAGGAPPLAEPEVYPNPFNVSTSLRFELTETGHVTAELYDVTGRSVALLTDQDYASGKHQVRIDGTSLASGLYFVHLITPTRQTTHKLMLIK